MRVVLAVPATATVRTAVGLLQCSKYCGLWGDYRDELCADFLHLVSLQKLQSQSPYDFT